ncbi:MAG: sulfite oxidase, partial [Gemmataceae bacterium]
NEPQNLEADFSKVNTFETPNEEFYVRSHFAVPKLSTETFRLSIEGHVERPMQLSITDLAALEQVTQPLTMECAGNGRVFLVPATRGLQWQFGAVGTARWSGVPLKTVLDKAGLKPGAVEVILVGADVGTVSSDPPSPGPIPFDRSIPIEKALKPEVMLATGMNGEPLTPAHGFPVRAVVGGWYGMASIKWLSRIIVTTKPYDGFWQTMDYSTYERRDGGLASLTPITTNLPKAQIAQPQYGSSVVLNEPFTIRGAAWAGERNVAKVQISVDGGTTFSDAKLLGEAKPFCWQLWEFAWTPTTAGPVQLIAVATDDAGQTQPAKRDPNRRTYVINHQVPVPVTVRTRPGRRSGP